MSPNYCFFRYIEFPASVNVSRVSPANFSRKLHSTFSFSRGALPVTPSAACAPSLPT
ncbi:hypothetical protein J6590_004333, partial [Homalodisca vitripennis]